MYEAVAHIYDAMYHFRRHVEESARVQATISRLRPHARTMLEVACGTGLMLEEFRRHFDVEGLDISQGLLARAAERLPDVPLHRADMAYFDLGRTFDVVCILFRSIAFAKTRERFTSTIGSMARHVAPGGLLLVEPYFTPEAYWAHRVTLNELKTDALKIAWMYVSARDGLVARQENHWLVGTSRGVDHITELHELGLFSREDYEAAFAAAGLQLDYDARGPSGIGLYLGTSPAG